MFKINLLTLLYAFVVYGQHIIDPPCPERPVFNNFDVNKYSGKWFEISRYEQKYEIGCYCVSANYTVNEDKTIDVQHCFKKEPEDTPSCFEGKGVLTEPDSKPLEGKIDFGFRGEESSGTNHVILDTDYENYSVVYYCKTKKDAPGKYAEGFWLLSRHKQLTPEIKSKTDAYINKYFDPSLVQATKQHGDGCDENV